MLQSGMAKRSPARRYLAVRVSQGGYTVLAELAKAETRGNVSAMLRKLLREALTARRDVTQRWAADTPDTGRAVVPFDGP